MSIADVVRPVVDADVAGHLQVLAPGFRARAAQTEADRTVSRQTVDELVAAGTARLLVPREHGGLDRGLRDLVEATTAAAAGCPATGWVAAQMAHHPHIVGMFPAQAQDDVWAAGPDVVIASSTAPGGRAERVGGGYRLTGRHPFASGINGSTWIIAGAMVPAPTGPPEWRLFLVDESRYTVDDVWRTAGMRGTGSNTVAIDDVFVPEGHTLAQVDAREGRAVGGTLNADPKFRLPWNAFAILGFTATMLGAAEGAYEHARAALAQKRTPTGVRVAEGQVVQVDIAFAAARIAAARRTLLGIADRADAGGSYTLADRAIVGRDNTFAAMLLVEAVDMLLAMSGTGAFVDTSPIQQAWRDVHFAAAHISMNRTDTGSRYGRVALEVEETSTQGFF